MSDSTTIKRAPIPSLYLNKGDWGEFYDHKGLCDWEVNENFVELQKAFDELGAWATELESRLAKLEGQS